MQQLLNAFKARAAAIDGQQGQSLWGTVVAVQGSPFRVKVEIQPSGLVTGWLPVMTLAAGHGWGLLLVPQNGMQARMEPSGGSGSHLVVTGFAYSTTDPPPNVPNAVGTGGVPNTTNVQPQPGELMMVHQTGATLRFCPNGTIYSRGTWVHEGTFHANGDISDQHGTLDRLRGAHNAHGHPYNAGSSPSVTSVPDHQDSE